MYEDSEPHASTGERALLQKHQQDLHRLLLPPTERKLDKDAANRPLSSRQHEVRRQVDQNGCKLLREKIEQLEEKALPLEEKWRRDSSSLPFMVRGKAVVKLDRLEEDESGLWDRLNASQGKFGGKEEEEEHHKWLARTEGNRRKLQGLREERRKKMGDSGRNSFSSEGSSSESPQDSAVRQPVRRLQRRGSIENLSVGRGIAHPRRGVGTLSETSSNEEWSS